MRGNNLITTVDLKKIFIISTKRDGSKAEDFMATLAKVAPPMGISVSDNYHLVMLDNDRTDNFVHTIQRNVQEDTQMV